MREVVFQVRSNGHEYVIYTNGETEGFEEGAAVCNYYPLLVASAVVAECKARELADAGRNCELSS